MRRFAWAIAALALSACVVAGATSAGADKYLQRIALPIVNPTPPGFSPEGVAIDKDTFYAGRTALNTGGIWAGSLLTGTGDWLVKDAPGHMAYGIFPSHGRLWVAGGSTGKAFVYDQQTGEELAAYVLEPGPTSRINDVYVTADAAYFTCGSVVCTGATAIYKVAIGEGHKLSDPKDPSSVTKIQLPIPVRPAPAGARDGLNGIRGWDNDRFLIVGQTGTGKLWKVDPDAGTATEIALNEPVPTNDGMIVDGKIVYSVSNQTAGYIAAIRMADDASSGEVLAHLGNDQYPLRNSATADQITNKKFIYVLARDNNHPTDPVGLTRVEVPKNKELKG